MTSDFRPGDSDVPVLSDELVWNLDTTLAQILAQGIGRLREMDHGYPGALTEASWHAILEEMVAGFQSYAEARDHVPDFGRLNKSLDLLREWFPHLWV
jgi:hypothetical protein